MLRRWARAVRRECRAGRMPAPIAHVCLVELTRQIGLHEAPQDPRCQQLLAIRIELGIFPDEQGALLAIDLESADEDDP